MKTTPITKITCNGVVSYQIDDEAACEAVCELINAGMDFEIKQDEVTVAEAVGLLVECGQFVQARELESRAAGDNQDYLDFLRGER